MAWIESHQTLREHPKLTILAENLGIPKAQAIGHLHLLWWWCIDYAVDGLLDRYTPPQIAGAAGWQGNAEELIKGLADSRFLDRGPLRIHDWLDFCGDLIKKRLEYKKEKRRRTKRLGVSLRKTENSQPTSRTVPAVPTVPVTPTAGVVSAAPYERPDKGRDPIAFLVMTYKEGLGVPFDDRPWDKQFWSRWSAAAKVILDSLGNVDDAVSYLQFQAKQLAGKDLSWSLKTVADRAVLYAAKKRGKNESPHRKRVPGTDAESGTGEESGGLRALPSGGAILDAVRGRKEVADGN